MLGLEAGRALALVIQLMVLQTGRALVFLLLPLNLLLLCLQLLLNTIEALWSSPDSKPTACSRHMDIQHFAIHDWRAGGEIDMSYIPTTTNCSVADQRVWAGHSTPAMSGVQWAITVLPLLAATIAVAPSIQLWSFPLVFTCAAVLYVQHLGLTSAHR